MNFSKPHTLIMAPDRVESEGKMELPSITIGEKADQLSLGALSVKLSVVDLSVYYKQFKALDKVSIDFSFLMVDQHQSGSIVEICPTEQIFINPKNQQTEDYVTGRFG